METAAGSSSATLVSGSRCSLVGIEVCVVVGHPCVWLVRVESGLLAVRTSVTPKVHVQMLDTA